jgi:hypothetical protein
VAANGLGFSVALVLSEVGKIERLLTLLPDSPAVYSEWKRLVESASKTAPKLP